MLHYLLTSGEVSPVFERIERAAIFIEVLAVGIIVVDIVHTVALEATPESVFVLGL